ncbi:hypothetical protein BDQ12DRAFT_677164 [Crucibulum laeve]|uniref:Methyltransferase type 11 domain-containing protein n=1 Tax=Crucibulum laeve TaxID=68775 RepID=A0A5C3MEE3_9AGAR|nr:hypothetical protein BDQ12DRAFT_677164 [Crucibulum laeve]
MDRSRNLLDIAKTAGGSGEVREVVWGNVLDNGWRAGAFDYAISIATIHHLATPQRRRLAVQRLLQAVSPCHGRVLIYVWAIEQDELSKRQIPTANTEAQTSTGKDVVVPWVKQSASNKSTPGQEPQVFNRYYHMFAKGELAGIVLDAAWEMGLKVGPKPDDTTEHREGIEIVQDGWERSNYYVELRRWETR